MSKKNLAGSAIEGGRAKHSRYEEHESVVRERAQSRLRLRRMLFDRDYWDETVVQDRRALSTWIDKDFDDKLNPVRRWLDTQVGRQWDDVYSEIKKKFDSRTTAGRHILYGHIIPMVGQWSDHDSHLNDFTVDQDGILHKNPTPWWRKKNKKTQPTRLYKQPTEKQLAEFFADGRRVDEESLTWYTPARVIHTSWLRCDRAGACAHPDWKHKSEFETYPYRKNYRAEYWYHLKEYWCYRQGKRLTDEEIEFWNRLSSAIRAERRMVEDEYKKDTR